MLLQKSLHTYNIKITRKECICLRIYHINGIENFGGFVKFRGVHKHTFYLHIKGDEMRSIHEYN